MDWEKASAELRKKLNPANVKPPAKFGPKGDYIEGWLAIDEANRIFGFGAWSYEVRAVSCVAEKPKKLGKDQKDGWGVTYTAHVRVIVGDVIREDFGAGHGYDVDLGLAHESAIKEAVTDSLKRALRTFGNPFGLALYDKTRENVGVDEPPPPPPFNPAAAGSRIMVAATKCQTVESLKALKAQEYDTLLSIKEADDATYQLVTAALTAAFNRVSAPVPMPPGMADAVGEGEDLRGTL